MIDESLLVSMWDAQNNLNKTFIEQIDVLQSEVKRLKSKLRKQQSKPGVEHND